MKLTKNFYLSEFIESNFYDLETQTKVWSTFKSKESELLPQIQKLSNQLQTVRDYINRPIIINIAYRPLFYEISKGRNGTSQHVLGKAADIRVKDMLTVKLHEVIEHLISQGEILQGGLGLYDNFIHYDIRGFKARWDYRKKI